MGDLDVIRLTYGMDTDELNERFGMAPYDRANKVRVVSIDWFCEPVDAEPSPPPQLTCDSLSFIASMEPTLLRRPHVRHFPTD